MNRWSFLVIVALAALAGLVATAPNTWAGTEPEAEMEAWVQAMSPGEPHARLAERAGEWKAVVTIWNESGGTPTVSEGVSLKTMVMGGRFLREEFSGEVMGRPFRGVGLTGYDNVTKEYVSVWYDNMGTGIHVSRGRDDGKRGLAFTATHHDPVTARPVKARSTSRATDPDHHAFESYNTLGDGSEFLHMRVEYTRASS